MAQANSTRTPAQSPDIFDRWAAEGAVARAAQTPTPHSHDLNAQQLRQVLEAIAGKAYTLREMIAALQAKDAGSEHTQTAVLDGCEVIAATIGALADQAGPGRGVAGDLHEWFCGPSFRPATAAGT